MRIENNKIIFDLPVTTPTGKVRVKRRKDYFGEPIATKTNPFTSNDYIEWQISYYKSFNDILTALQEKEDLKEFFSGLKSDEILIEIKKAFDSKTSKDDFFNKLEKIVKKYKDPIKYQDGVFHMGFELADLLKIGFINKLITSDELNNLLKFGKDIKSNETIEENYSISRKATKDILKGGFVLHYEEAPLFIHDLNNNFFIEIILKHKQRAVGYQSMVYLCIKAKQLKDYKGNSFIGRVATTKERAYFVIEKEAILETSKAFLIASQDHKKDMMGIIEQITTLQP